MARSFGWSVLAAKTLELGFLALGSWAMNPPRRPAAPKPFEAPEMHVAPETHAAPETQSAPEMRIPAEVTAASEPDFLGEAADAQARYVVARDEHGEISAAFLSDGRLRLTDGENRRFAGMLQNDKADLLEIETGAWSTVYVRRAPDGKTQLEVHGGPYDARVLTCEPSRQ